MKFDKWINDSEKYEFCKSYGVSNIPSMEFKEHQENFYIYLLSYFHEIMEAYLERGMTDDVKKELLDLADGLILYSQNETYEDFYGVNKNQNFLYVASVYYLCDYTAISSLLMCDIDIDEFHLNASQTLAYIISGGGVEKRQEYNYAEEAWVNINKYMHQGNEIFLDAEIETQEKRYKERNFESSTDFYMTLVLRCVLRKFKENNLWKSLKAIDSKFDWSSYVRHSRRQHIFSFLPSQQDALDKGLLNFQGAFSLKMPTSAGKSYITELLIHYAIRNNPEERILYLAPLRALSRELRDHYQKIHQALGFSFATKYGGSASAVDEEGIDNAQLLIATPESFEALELKDDDFFRKFSLVICDEGQLLDDFTRGINYEMLLTRLRRNENVHFLFISAVIPNIQVVNEWLGGKAEQIGDSTYRPSSLKLALAKVSKDCIDLDVYRSQWNTPQFHIEGFASKKEANNESLIDAKREKHKLIPTGCILALKAMKAGSVLLFTTGKTSSIGCTQFAKHIIQWIEKGIYNIPLEEKYKQDEMEKLYGYIAYQLGEEHLLTKSISNGFAFHHGDLPQNIREAVERTYNDKVFHLIISNTTLAEGVNLPIKTIVLANISDPAIPGNYLNNARLKNIIGRVGRAGRERYGTVILPTVKEWTMPVKLVKQAISLNDDSINKMRGTLYSLIQYLCRKKQLTNESDINQMLSNTVFSEAIDMMIVRSADEEQFDDLSIDELVSDSLAYRLSDDNEKERLKTVFNARYKYLQSECSREKYHLIKDTGASLREVDYIEANVDYDYIRSFSNYFSPEWIAYIIDFIMEMPSVKETLNDMSAKMKRLFSDVNKLKEVASDWMNGLQYIEISKHLNIENVDDVILYVKYLQGPVHDKAASTIAYLSEMHEDLDTILTNWPKYLRLGINTYFEYNLNQNRVTERILVHALQKYCEEHDSFPDIDSIDTWLVYEGDALLNYIAKNNYPRMVLDKLNELVEYKKM